MSQRGSGYIGSSDILTSVAGAEIIPQPPSDYGWTGGYSLYKFSWLNINQPAHIIINGGNPIFIDEKIGFNCDENDAPIRSFKIVESGVTFYWLGAF